MIKAITITALLIAAFAANSFGQTFEDEPLPIDAVIEADANHNVDVAWQYFKLKKAYKAALMRMEETIATLSAFPGYKKMDEVLYLYGMSSFYLSEGKGSQKIVPDRLPEEDRERYATDRLREEALAFLTKIVDEYPDSKYREKAEETIEKLKKK